MKSTATSVVGQRFDRLVVTGEPFSEMVGQSRRWFATCHCDCGQVDARFKSRNRRGAHRHRVAVACGPLMSERRTHLTGTLPWPKGSEDTAAGSRCGLDAETRITQDFRGMEGGVFACAKDGTTRSRRLSRTWVSDLRHDIQLSVKTTTEGTSQETASGQHLANRRATAATTECWR